jgi:hypothetical protein
MSISDFLQWIEQYPTYVIMYMIIVPAVSFIVSMFLNSPEKNSRVNYVYSVLVYATCVPGIVSLVLSGYDFFFQKTDLKEANVFIYFLPIISMIATLVIINKATKMAQIPGFSKLSGLMLMIGVTSILAFILHKMIFVTAFVGSIYTLIGLFILIFIGVKLGWDRMMN